MRKGPRPRHWTNWRAYTCAYPVSEGAAYWSGFILADGSVRYRGGPSLTVNLNRKDRDHLAAMRDFLMPTGSMKLVARTNSYVLRVYGVDLLRLLRRFGIVPRKSYGHPLPILADSEFWPFVRGYFDGDGSVGKYRHGNHCYWHLSFCGQPEFLAWLQAGIGMRLGYGGLLTKGTRVHHLKFNGRNARAVASALAGVPSLERKQLLLKGAAA